MADKNNITQFNGGLDLNNPPQLQPKGTYRFALNTVNETELGDTSLRSNEESNEYYTSLTPGYSPIGKCYIGSNQTVILSVSSDDTVSEIGIMNDDGKYVVHVNDADSPEADKLKFSISRQIDITYRLRKGCERTIYFVGKGYPPRYFNFNKPDQFKRGVKWAQSQFNLYKKIEVFPTIDSVEVLDSSGNLTPGSYTIMVQHLDEDLNGTEFYELVKDINIYNDSLSMTYSDIEGSSRIGDPDEPGPYLYSKTNKAIKITLDAVDKNFTYVRFAFVERISGTGQVTQVTYSDALSVFNPVFTYTGDNYISTGTLAEVELFNINGGIQSAEHIEQIDNMLILAKVTGEQAKICKLQRYASKIKVDCFVKDIILTSVNEDHNPKNPLVVHNGLSYQPGDLASLGVVYVFDDYSVSPVLHIPGKSNEVSKDMVFSPGSNVYPMSNVGNKNISEAYLENDTCGDESYWGLDSEGNTLSNQNVRHHRFPTRDEIGIGFVKRTSTSGDTTTFKKIQVFVKGIVKKSDTTIPYVAKDFTIIVKYKRNGIDELFQDSIYPDSNIKPDIISSNIFIATDVITEIRLFYQEIGSTIQNEILLTNDESLEQENGLTYKATVGELTENNVGHLYTVPIMGLKFSNVELPTEDEIGKKIIGYQIVRQERRDVDKTVLDSAVIFPMQKAGRNVSTALLAPEFFTDSNYTPSTCQGSEDPTYPTCFNISKRNIMLVTPTHKFMDKTHDGFTNIEQVGTFEREYVSRNATSMQNVYDGTSASGDEDKKTRDDDGFSLRQGIRFTGLKYVKTKGTPLNITNENTQMYNLNAVNYAETEDNTETLYNLSCDNKALVLSSSKTGINLTTYGPDKYEFPYVYIRKNNSTFYQNFRSNPYYLVDSRVFTEETTQVFGGDTYIAPLRHSNHVFGNAIGALRRKKMSVWAWVGAILIAAISIVLSAISGGSSLIIGGAILTGLGALATFHAARIEVAKFNEIYGDKWQANLDRTVFDWVYARLFIREHPDHGLEDYEPDPLYLSWADDTFRWFGEIVGDLWFETQLNLSLRVPPNNMENNYLKPLKSYMGDNTSQLMVISEAEYIKNNSIFSGRFHRYRDLDIGPSTPEEWYFVKKITKADSNRPTGTVYTGLSIPQIYLINPDHCVTEGIKKYYTIPLEYDCCSECIESFPHRVHYSQQSFQEEKSDNYRIFLPNNYRDIEGETGEITNIFRLYENLYIHTKEALWSMPKNQQERVTDEIVSFIGTGEYFNVPPKKILDAVGFSAGTRHKWGFIKTPAGVFFPSENQRKIYQFDGKQLEPITNKGLSNWFKEHMEIELDRNYLNAKGAEYPYKDNPSNILGTGFLGTYDSKKERVIFTKRDLSLNPSIYNNQDDGICMSGGDITIFPNITQTILDQSSAGWKFSGIENCKLMFYKDVIKHRDEIREVVVTVANNADIIVHLDMSGSFDDTSRNQIKSAINTWMANFGATNPNWTGNLYYSIQDGYTSQRCWKILKFIKSGQGIQTPSGSSVNPSTLSEHLVVVSFVNENLIDGYGSNICYHPRLANPMGNYASDFIDDYNEFITLYTSHVGSGGTFNALNYPIVYNDPTIGSWTTGFLQHVLAVLKGVSYTSTEVSNLTVNPFMSAGGWSTLLTSLQGNNIYPDNGLENYGWRAVTNRGWGGSGDVITSAQFQIDMDAFLQGIQTTEQITVSVPYIEREYLYLDGTILQDPVEYNNSWTMSYSLKEKSWTSWHSYLPHFYISVPEKFYSWVPGDDSIWRHNVTGKYLEFYGIKKPFIIDYVSTSEGLVTKIWDSVNFILDSKEYDSDSKEYNHTNTFFNKAIFSNSIQCSGLLNIKLKDNEDEDYLGNQVDNLNVDEIIIDRNEKNWSINNMRDTRVDYSKPIWLSNISAIQHEYYIDKVLNSVTLDSYKDWSEMESFRDKYLSIRLIFDKFVDTKLIMNFSNENENISRR